MEWREQLGDDELVVKVAELLVATSDASDPSIDQAVPEVLRLLRERMRMDVVFVSEFTDGQRVFRAVDQAPGAGVIEQGGADPLEATWCQRVVDGRLPELIPDSAPFQASGQAPATQFPIGTYISTAIVLASGEVYGTLCCFSYGVNPAITEQDVKKLRYTAQLTAQKIERSRRLIAGMALAPIADKGFTRAR